MTEATGINSTGFKLLQWLGPMVLAGVIGYGTVQFTSGTREQRINVLETEIAALKEQQKQSITQRDMTYILDNIDIKLKNINDKLDNRVKFDNRIK